MHASHKHPHYEKLYNEIRRERNGAIVDLANTLCNEKIFSYGVSLPTIRQIALPYAPDQSFAITLFEEPIRELKLAAIFIAQATHITPETMTHWSHNFITLEIAESCASFLFSKSPLAAETALLWIDNTTDPIRLKAALIMLGKSIRTGAYEIDFDEIEKKISHLIQINHAVINRGIAFLLESFVRKDKNNRKHIEYFLKKQKQSDCNSCAILLDEIEYW